MFLFLSLRLADLIGDLLEASPGTTYVYVFMAAAYRILGNRPIEHP